MSCNDQRRRHEPGVGNGPLGSVKVTFSTAAEALSGPESCTLRTLLSPLPVSGARMVNCCLAAVAWTVADLSFTPYGKIVPVVGGAIEVPNAPGLGADPEPELIERFRITR